VTDAVQAESPEEQGAAIPKALQLISEAPSNQARQLARIILNNLDLKDQSQCAEQLLELNLALGNHIEAATAAAMSALNDQREGNYKVRHNLSWQNLLYL
jgi:hypothetical protein